jgi:hypothetical protein
MKSGDFSISPSIFENWYGFWPIRRRAARPRRRGYLLTATAFEMNRAERAGANEFAPV